MPTKLENRAPRTRCYKCGSPEIFAACHHCGRPMCKKDKPQVAENGKPFSQEFADLNLQNPAPYHCEKCDHLVKGRLLRIVAASAASAVLGLVLIFASLTWGLLIFFVGAAAAVAAYFGDRRRMEETIRTRPPFPVVPNIDSAEVLETLHGKLTLDREGKYRTSVSPVEGELNVTMTFGKPDQDRLQSYRDKYRLTAQDKVEFSAGFAILDGQAGLDFLDPSVSGTVIPLAGDVADHAFFDTADRRTGAQWKNTWRHRLTDANTADSIPIWLTPSLVPESDQRALEVELQWIDFGPADNPLAIDHIESVTLHAPVAWGNVESASYHLPDSTKDKKNTVHRVAVGIIADPEDPEETVRLIEWKQLPLPAAKSKERRVSLSVRFENRIELEDTLRGNLKITFGGALSGVEGVAIYHPLGRKRGDTKRSKNAKTKVTADFALSLLGIRYQDVRVVPDHKEIRDRDRNETDEFPGIVPDHETVIALTNAMSDDGYYVKRVIENPPRVGVRANVANRYWDIAGRHYDGVYPVDFHIILTGEEVYNGDIRAQAGNTKIRLTVQGAYASSEMERGIEREWERLHGITVETLEARPRSTPIEPLEQVNEPQPRHSRPETGVDNRVTGLRRQRDELTDALLAGRISEEIYREIIAKIDRELNEANGTYRGT